MKYYSISSPSGSLLTTAIRHNTVMDFENRTGWVPEVKNQFRGISAIRADAEIVFSPGSRAFRFRKPNL